MDAIRASGSHSPSISPLMWVDDAVAPVGESWECRVDGMVKNELEAAEALAGLAYTAMPKPNGDKLGRKRGESVIERVEYESPAGLSRFDPVDKVPDSSNGFEDQTVFVKQNSEKRRNMMTKLMKVEQNTEKLNPTCTTSYASSSASKSRQNFTEAEKEIRRIRRVLANRESARQTIRRRQAIYEELTRKAADLAWENENLKREKELAVKKYDSLKSTNECLKAQMTKIMKVEAEETQEESNPTHVEIATCPSTNSPIFICNQPSFFPVFWPSITQPPNSVQLQCGPQNSIVFPSQIPMPATGKPDLSSSGKGNPVMINGSGSPLYFLPCPWLLSLPQRSNEHHPPSFNLNEKPNETPPSNQCTASSSSKSLVHIENHHPLLKKVKAETSNSAEPIPANNLHENPFGFPPDGDGRHTGSPPRGKVLMPAPLSCIRPEVFVEHGNTPQLDRTCDLKVISTDGDVLNGAPEMCKDPAVPGEKVGDVITASEARKRRKELTKLKNLYSRQFRMQYVEKG